MKPPANDPRKRATTPPHDAPAPTLHSPSGDGPGVDPATPVDAPAASSFRVELRPVADLIPYARNSRVHSPAQVAQLAASIAEFGFTNPVLADRSGIVAGHGRVLAARQLWAAGKTIKLPNGSALPQERLPVIDCTGWSEAQRRAYVIADNKLALNAEWDAQLLVVELQDLQVAEFDLSLIGFDNDELATLSTSFGDPTAATTSASHDDRFLVLADCGNEATQAALFDELNTRGLTCKLMS